MLVRRELCQECQRAAHAEVSKPCWVDENLGRIGTDERQDPKFLNHAG